MRLPWVPRGTYEKTVKELDALREMLNRETSSYARHAAAVDHAMERLERQAAEHTAYSHAAVQAFRDEREQHERDMVRSEARFAELFRAHQLLRLQGFVPQPEPQPLQKPHPVTEAINIASHGDPALRRQMIAQVEQDRIADPQITDEELIIRIRRGNRPFET